MLKQQVEEGLDQLIERIRKDQSPDGAWHYPFETGISTDCYMIILLRSLEIDDENLIKGLTERIVSKQEANGAWKLFYDEGAGNLSLTIEAYYALLYSGYYRISDQRMQGARRFILAKGGLGNTHMLTKIMLALTGQLKWPATFPLPVELILIPPTFPVNFYRFSEYGRVNLTPIMILTARKFQLKTAKTPDLSELFVRGAEDFFNDREEHEWRSFHEVIHSAIKRLIGLPNHLHRLAEENAKHYMLNRIEPDGTFYGYFSSTFLMIFALLSFGYKKNHPLIVNAVNGLKNMKTEIKGFPHMQYTTATIWNTALMNYALQEAEVLPAHPMVQKANAYLLHKQHVKYGDWVVHNHNTFPGGWGFAHQNTIHPDVDDTTAALRSIARSVTGDSTFHQSWELGVLWVLSMQNRDGGWPAFEKNTDSEWLKLLPIEKAEYILMDPSSADLTGRTLEFLGNYTNLSKNHSAIISGIRWLIKNQGKDGSWYGRWGICYLYGTWAAVTGLTAVGVLPVNPAIKKACNWIEKIQNPDGGWGESCKSDTQQKYVPLNASTLTHTAWAVDALISVADQPTTSITKGIDYLLNHLDKEDWTTYYPKGAGMAGDFYIHYHSYRYLFPLLAIAHYQKKYLKS